MVRRYYSGPVPNEPATGQGRAALLVVHTAAIFLRPVPVEDTIGKGRAAFGVINPAAIILRPVCAEQTISHGRIAVIVVIHSTAEVAQRGVSAVLGKYAVVQDGAALIVIYPSTARQRVVEASDCQCSVRNKRAVGQRRITPAVVYPASIAAGVVDKHTVGQDRAALLIVHAAAVVLCDVCAEHATGQDRIAA